MTSLDSTDISGKRILFFSAPQAIAEHAFIERYIADVLLEENAHVSFLGCKGTYYPFCLAMSSYGLTEDSSVTEKKKICYLCKKSQARTWNKLQSDFIDDWLTHEDLEKIEHTLKTLRPKDIAAFEVDGLRIARLAVYEFILNLKINTLESFEKIEWKKLSTAIQNGLKTYYAYKNYIKKNPTDVVIVSNSNYGIYNIVKTYNETLGIKTYSILSGLNFSQLYDSFYITHLQPELHLRSRVKFFEEHEKELRLSEEQFEEILKYIDHTLSSKSIWVYSSTRTSSEKETVFKKLGLNPELPTALLSMSSKDESFATDFSVLNSTYINTSFSLFQGQPEWIRETISYFKEHPDQQLIIRIHPREYPTRRDQVTSYAVAEYEKLFSNLPSNVVVNYPHHEISIYDLFQFVHMHLTAWSSVGLESAWFGIPTIAVTRWLSLYSTEFVNSVPKDVSQYHGQIASILSKPLVRDEALIRKAYRWLTYDFNHTLIRTNSHGFWDPPKTDFISKVTRKLKKYLQGTEKTYADFKKQTRFDANDRSVLLEVLNGNKQVHEIKYRNQIQSERSHFDSFYKKYVKLLNHER